MVLAEIFELVSTNLTTTYSLHRQSIRYAYLHRNHFSSYKNGSPDVSKLCFCTILNLIVHVCSGEYRISVYKLEQYIRLTQTINLICLLPPDLSIYIKKACLVVSRSCFSTIFHLIAHVSRRDFRTSVYKLHNNTEHTQTFNLICLLPPNSIFIIQKLESGLHKIVF